jgi:hypothetical protein
MNAKLVLAIVAIVAAFGIAAMIGPVTIATLPPALAQNMTMGAENMTAGNVTGAGGNGTK